LQCRLAMDIGQLATQGRLTVQVSNGHRAVTTQGRLTVQVSNGHRAVRNAG